MKVRHLYIPECRQEVLSSVGWGCKVGLVDFRWENFEGLCTEEVTGSEKDIFEGGFKFAAFCPKKRFNVIDSEVQREEYLSSYPYTQ